VQKPGEKHLFHIWSCLCSSCLLSHLWSSCWANNEVYTVNCYYQYLSITFFFYLRKHFNNHYVSGMAVITKKRQRQPR
jgi:hypothetical protein